MFLQRSIHAQATDSSALARGASVGRLAARACCSRLGIHSLTVTRESQTISATPAESIPASVSF